MANNLNKLWTKALKFSKTLEDKIKNLSFKNPKENLEIRNVYPLTQPGGVAAGSQDRQPLEHSDDFLYLKRQTDYEDE
mgnify:CR=1 FL=1